MPSPRLIIHAKTASYEAIYLCGSDGLCQLFDCNLTVDSKDVTPLQNGLGQIVSLEFISDDGYSHTVNHTLLAIEDKGLIGPNPMNTAQAKRRYSLTLGSRLSLLDGTEHSRVFVDTALPDILCTLLADAGYHHAQIQFSLARPTALPSQVVQAMESNLVFFKRLLCQYGLFYRFHSIGSDTGIVITDNNQSSPYLARGLLRVHHAAGFNSAQENPLINGPSNRPFVGFSACEVTNQYTPGLASAIAHEYRIAGNDLAAHNFAQPVSTTLGEASHVAQHQSQAIQTFSEVITLTGNVPDVYAGCSFSLQDDSGLQATGDYLCISVEHHCQLPSDESSQNGLSQYHCVVKAIPRATPFKLAFEAFAPLPMVFSATVESMSAAPTLHDNGEQFTKIGFDHVAKAPLTSTTPLRKLVSYACANQPQATGWHFPLAHDTQVLLGCLNNDPSQAYIIGFDMNKSQPAVVNSDNAMHNRVLSRSGHELCFDDDDTLPTIVLQTLGGEHYFELNAQTSAKQYIEWVSRLGNISVHSAGDLLIDNEEGNIDIQVDGHQHIDAKDSVNIKVAADSTTKKDSISIQSATQYRQTAKRISTASDGPTTLLTEKSLYADADSHLRLQSDQGDIAIHAPKGATIINAKGNISITGNGSGDITLFNQGGMITLDSTGNVALIGHDVLTLNGQMITLDGEVKYDITSPQTASEPSTVSPPSISRISDLNLSGNTQLSVKPNTIDLQYAYQDGDPVQHAPYVLSLADGTTIEGTLDSAGKATVTDVPTGQFTVQYGEDTRDYAPVDNTTPNPLHGKITPKAAIAMVESGDTSLLDEAGDLAASAGDWLWGTLQGDFNENPSTSQIVVGSIISMIPVIDQIMDCKDICANIMILTDEDDENDTAGWIALTLTAIGLVPIFGSAVKGVFKVILANAGKSLDVALAVLRKLGKGDPEKYIRDLDWAKLTQDATTSVKEKVTIIKEALHTVTDSWAVKLVIDNATLKSINQKITKLSEFEQKIDRGIADAMQTIKGKVNGALDEYSGGKVRLGNTSTSMSVKTVELKAPDYEIKQGVNAFANSPVIFKRAHKDGQQEGMWPDSYTLINGKPLGAKVGKMPSEYRGIKTASLDVTNKINDGWPDIAIKRTEFENFTDLEAATLPKGTTIYRVIDEGTSEAKFKSSGGYWALELPSSKTQWRSQYAVKDSWNDNGHYIKHTLEQDTKVWQGGVAGQKYEEFDNQNFYLEGGGTQLYVEPGLIKNEQIQPKLTNWPDAL